MDDRTVRRAIIAAAISIAAAIGLALWIGATTGPAAADGCNPEVQDCGKGALLYGAEPLRRAPVAYNLSVTPDIIRRRGGSVCGENIPVWRCDNLKARFKTGIKAENERRRQDIRNKRPLREVRDSYRDERGRKVIVIDDGERRRDRGDDRNCKRRITVTSKPRMTKGLACGEARKLWSMRALDEHGGEFARISSAKGVSSDPHPFHEGAWRDVCTFSAVPCRDNRRDD